MTAGSCRRNKLLRRRWWPRPKARGLELTGPNGLLKLFTKNVLETALNEELTEHLGHEKNQVEAGRDSTNVRNGSRAKTVISDAAGEVRIDVPRDREGTFEPQIVKKRQRRLTEVDEIVLSLYAKGMTTGEISAHFAEIYGASVSKETISRITDKVVAEMTEHLGHEKNQAEPGRESTNVRNGSRGKTVISDAAGEVEISVPRDRE